MLTLQWVKPTMVVQVAFVEWTRDGLLRHPRFIGARIDKAAADVHRESNVDW
jgi:bifunctional non-homologous end joining protein LigD